MHKCCFNTYALAPLQTPAPSRVSQELERKRRVPKLDHNPSGGILSGVCIYGLRLPKGRSEAPWGDRMRISLTVLHIISQELC